MEKLERKKIYSFKNGFSTIELLVYLTIVTVVVTVLTNFIIDATKTATVARQARQVQQNTRLVMSKIMRDVRGASASSVPQTDELQLTINGQIVGYYLDGDVIYYYINSRPATPVASDAVSSAEINVDVLYFIKHNDSVSITLTAEPANPLLGSGSAYSLTSAFTPRHNVY